MPKVKKQIIKEKKDYLYVLIGVIIIVMCIFLIGRVGTLGNYLGLLFSFIFGDFSTLILAIILLFTLNFLVFKKKFDYHNISFIGTIFISIAVLMFAHIGIYDALDMNNYNIITKTINLFNNYLKNYEITFSCGGGIVGAIALQISCLLIGKIGSIIVGIALIVIGVSYFANIDVFKLFKGGKFSKIPKFCLKNFIGYFKNINFNLDSVKTSKKISLNMLEDTDAIINFSMQIEINKEKFDNFKQFIKENKIYCMCDQFCTSYSSSRFILKFANKNDNDLRLILNFFNRNCFFIKNNNEIFLDYPNQFRKLLTLKNLLVDQKNDNNIPIGIDLNGNRLDIDISMGKFITIIGDYNSGIKTFLRTLILSILIKNINYENIYFYDLENEFPSLNNSKFKYINNERSASIALDEAFNEYERRSEILKYYNADTIKEANSLIAKKNESIKIMNPIIHILYFDIKKFSDTLLQKIIYAIRFSIKVGITIIIVARNKNSIVNLELNKSDIIAFNVGDVGLSVKLFGSDMACRLQKKGDILYRKNGAVYHGQAPYVSCNDFENIVK